MRRKTAVAGFSYLAGVFVASFLTCSCIFAAAGIVIACFGLLLLCNFKGKIFVLTVVFAFSAGLVIYGIYEKTEYEKVTAYDGVKAHFEGEILDYGYIGNDMMTVTAKGKINDTKATITAFVPDKNCEYYNKISFDAIYKKIENNISFDSLDYNKPNGIYLTANSVSDVSYSQGGFSVLKIIRNYSDYYYDKIEEILPHDQAAFIGAMICGNKSGMDDYTKTNLYRVGIGHIFSVSGTHLVIVSFVIKYLLELVKASKRKRIILCQLVIVAFALFAGMSSSVIRAAIMMTVINLSEIFRRTPDSLTTLAICGILLTVFSPEKIRSASFLLSMSGAFALSVAAPAVVKAINYKGKFLKTVNSIISMCCVTLCSLPLSLMFFNQLSVVSPFSNVVFVPLCTAALALSVVPAFIGGAGVLSEILLTIAGRLVNIVMVLSNYLGQFKFTTIPLGYTYVKTVVLSGLVLTVILTAIKGNAITGVITASLTVACLVICSVVYMFVNRITYEIYVLKYENSCITVLNKNKKAVIIVSDDKNSDACIRLLENKGITEVEYVITYENPAFITAVYYNEVSFDYDFDNSLKAQELNSISCLGADISFYESGFEIVCNGKSIDICFSDTEKTGSSDLLIIGREDGLYAASDKEEVYQKDENGSIISAGINENEEIKIRRFYYAFG